MTVRMDRAFVAGGPDMDARTAVDEQAIEQAERAGIVMADFAQSPLGWYFVS